MENSQSNKHYWLYVLKLEQGKYYIGISTSWKAEKRIQQHMQGFYTAQWIRNNNLRIMGVASIIDLGEITKTQAEEYERKRTVQYMKKYGVNNARGGPYTASDNYLYIPLFQRLIVKDDAQTIGVIVSLLTMLAYFMLQINY